MIHILFQCTGSLVQLGLDYSKEVVVGSSVSKGTLPQEQTMEESTPPLSLLFLLLSGYGMELYTLSSYQVCMCVRSISFWFIIPHYCS